MAQRKTWEQLSPAYRGRLERKGITAEQHRTGATLATARGHISNAAEAVTSRFYRDRNRFVERQARYYGRDPDDVRELLDEYPRADVERLIREQRESEDAYHAGDPSAGRRRWEERDDRFPDWMFYYHGAFS